MYYCNELHFLLKHKKEQMRKVMQNINEATLYNPLD